MSSSAFRDEIAAAAAGGLAGQRAEWALRQGAEPRTVLLEAVPPVHRSPFVLSLVAELLKALARQNGPRSCDQPAGGAETPTEPRSAPAEAQ